MCIRFYFYFLGFFGMGKMVKKIITTAVFLMITACGTHEHEPPIPPSLDGVWATHDCSGKYEVIRIKDGTFEIKTNKTLDTKSLSGAVVIQGNVVKWLYETGEIYQNNFEFDGHTMTLYRSELVKFVKRADDFDRPVVNVTNNNNIDVKPADVNVDVKCTSCCNDQKQQRPPFKLPCFGG
jgi:hypothetical protein